MDIILKYFPDLTERQKEQISMLKPLYDEWNAKINVISRKDTDNFYERHVLHSLAIAKVISFDSGTTVLDMGTGGGFPGIPLAILFPEVQFSLVDSIAKKIKVVEAVSTALGLENVKPICARVETLNTKFDYVVSRAVTNLSDFMFLTKKLYAPASTSSRKGLYYLKGGDLHEELSAAARHHRITEISSFYEEEFFETKKVIYVR